MQSQVGASVRSNPACERTLLPPSFLSGTEFASPSHSAALNKFVSPNLGGTAKKQPLKLRGSPLRLPTRAPGPRERLALCGLGARSQIESRFISLPVVAYAPTERDAPVADFTDRFIKTWTDQRIAAARLGVRQFEAARLASEILDEAALQGLPRKDIETAVGMDLELYMFQALTSTIARQEKKRRGAFGMHEHFGQERARP